MIGRVNELLDGRPLSPPAREVFDPGLLSVLPAGHALRELVEDEHPELIELYGVLEERADLSSEAALAPAAGAASVCAPGTWPSTWCGCTGPARRPPPQRRGGDRR